MPKGQKHYFRDGTLYKGGIHTMPDGSLHSGARHSNSSKKLFHLSQLSKTAMKKAKTIIK